MYKTLLIFTLAFIVGLGYFHPITAITQDLGRHLKNGEIIVATHTIPNTNFFSYTYPQFPFINHHWLSEVILYVVFTYIGGFNGLLAITVGILIATFSLALLGGSKNKSFFSLTVSSLLYSIILFERTDIRPEIFSFLFLVLFITILYKNREKPTRLIFILPLLELLWINMHIYFFVGIAVLGMFFLEKILMKKTFDKKLFIVTMASVLALLFNPNTINGALYPLRVFQNYGYTIEENQNIFFLWQYAHLPVIIFFTIGVLVLFFLLVINRGRTRLIDWMLFLFFAALGTIAIRNLPLFVFGTIAGFSYYLNIFYTHTIQKKKIAGFPLQTLLLIVILPILLWNVKNSVERKGVGFGVETGAEKAADFFLKENIKGPVFNNFDIGSYLDYRFYPKEKVFVDGRPEAYPSSFFQNIYIPMQQTADAFQETDNYYHFNSIFFAHTDQTPWGEQFISQIVQNPKWSLVYLNDTVVILLKKNKTNNKIIEEFGMNKDKIRISNYNPQSFNSLAHLIHFLSTADWKEEEIKVYQDILKINPTNCPSLYNLSVLFTQQQSPLGQVYLNRFNMNCK